MIIINTMEDIQRLQEYKRLDNQLIANIKEYFKELTYSFTETNNWHRFSLKEHGPIIILEDKDNPHDLKEIGFPKEHGGILSTFPEFADVLNINDVSYYKIVIVCSNSYGLVVYSRVNQFDNEFEKWVNECLE